MPVAGTPIIVPHPRVAARGGRPARRDQPASPARNHHAAGRRRLAWGLEVRYSWEPRVLGSAGGPRRALPLLDADRFLIVNGDTLTDCDLAGVVQRHSTPRARVTMAVVPGDVGRYGGVLVDADGRVSGFARAPASKPQSRAIRRPTWRTGRECPGTSSACRRSGTASSQPFRTTNQRDGADAVSAADRRRMGPRSVPFESDAEFLDVGTRAITTRRSRPSLHARACRSTWGMTARSIPTRDVARLDSSGIACVVAAGVSSSIASWPMASTFRGHAIRAVRAGRRRRRTRGAEVLAGRAQVRPCVHAHGAPRRIRRTQRTRRTCRIAPVLDSRTRASISTSTNSASRPSSRKCCR